MPPPVSDKYNMALRKEQQEFIRDEIKTQLAEVVDGFRPHGWRKIAHWAREWGIAGALITVFIAMLGITIGALIQSFSHVKDETQFRTNTTRTLEETTRTLEDIQTNLRLLQASQVPKKILQELATLAPKQFTKNLPALRKVAEQPPAGVAPSAALLREVAQKLRSTDESSQDYWPTVLQFIQFASAGLSPDVPPPGPPTVTIANNHGFGEILPPILHQVVLLDGGDLGPAHFYNSRIKFTEHAVRMKDVIFTDCVFEMPISASPNEYLRNATRVLLASDLKSATISGL
jgi:hypothetical protein